MKRSVVILFVLLVCAYAQAKGMVGLSNETLRLDYIFSGTSTTCEISLSGMIATPRWYGRRVNMSKVPVAGNGEIYLEDSSGRILYHSSFSTLFQEWQATSEAKMVRRSFENTFLVPMPANKAKATIRLFDAHRKVCATMSHIINPDDILIRNVKASMPLARYIWQGGDSSEAIDVVIVAEGYTEQEMPTFYQDVQSAINAIFAHEPFASHKSDFNFIAVASPSNDSGVSIPRNGTWKESAVLSNFDTFYIDRYLTTSHIFKLYDLLSGVPCEHIIILANTDTYGGGGIYNSYTLTTAHHNAFRPVVVHEFGHSFGGLADEYDYGDSDPYYFPDVEPWEQNITTKADFKSKWWNVFEPGVGLYEGAGYQSKGVWRPAKDCRMRSNKCPSFCPVCQKALNRMISFYTVEQGS